MPSIFDFSLEELQDHAFDPVAEFGPEVSNATVTLNNPVTPVVDMVLIDFRELIKGFSTFLGEVLGGFIGGVLQGLKGTLEELLRGVVDMAKDLVDYATEKLKDVINETIDKLEGAAKRLMDRVVMMTKLMTELMEQFVETLSEKLLILLFEADIVSSTIVAGLPFTRDEARLVYTKPLWLRAGQKKRISEIVVRGVKLKKCEKFRLNEKEFRSRDLVLSDNEVRIPVSPELAKKIANTPAGGVPLVVEAVDNGLFNSKFVRIQVPVLPRLRLDVQGMLWPTLKSVEKYRGKWTSGPKQKDAVLTHFYPAPDPHARMKELRQVSLGKNKSSKVVKTKLFGSPMAGFEVTVELDGDMWWPIEKRAWMGYEYEASYETETKPGDQEKFAFGPETWDLSKLKTFQEASHSKGVELRGKDWHFECIVRVLAARSGGEETAVFEQKLTEAGGDIPWAECSMNESGVLVVTVETEALQGNPKYA